MPKGLKVKVAPPPDLTRCDFCFEPMKPITFDDRTCGRCYTDGWPRQGEPDYGTRLAHRRNPDRKRGPRT